MNWEIYGYLMLNPFIQSKARKCENVIKKNKTKTCSSNFIA